MTDGGITNQKESKSTSDEWRQRGEALLDTAYAFGFSLAITDPQGTVVAQRGFAEPTLADTAAGDRVSAILHSVLERAVQGRHVEEAVELPGPPARTMAMNGRPYFDEDGECAGAIAVVQDAGDRRYIYSGARDMVANLGHELKTPIGAIGLLAEAILINGIRPENARLVERLQTEAARAASVVEALLEVSRLETMVPRPSAHVMPVKPLVEAAISRSRAVAEHRGITLEADVDGHYAVTGPKHELTLALQHLLENALKYSPEGGSVCIAAEQDGPWVEISVSDDGPGIPREFQDRIFERFFRIDDARSRTLGGTGLGLAIVNRVVQNQGGYVRVESELGHGSTFTMRLPAAVHEEAGS